MSVNQNISFARSIILHEHALLSLTEVSSACAVQAGYIIKMVDEGVLTPAELSGCYYFSGEQLSRVQRALRLQRDLDLNLAGAALALQLLDEVETLRAQLRMFRAAKGEIYLRDD